MKAPADRVQHPLAALVRTAVPTIDYMALYRARVATQKGHLVDVVPDDPRLPGMSAIPLKLGVPGGEVQVSPGCYVLVGWEGGDPSRPHALVWEPDAVVVNLKITAARVQLGGDTVPVMDGVVTGRAVDTLTGLPMWMLGHTSTVVAAKK